MLAAMPTVAVFALLTTTACGVGIVIYTLPEYMALRVRGPTRSHDGVASVDDAIRVLEASGLRDWALVEGAQRLVTAKMEYSRRNNWDSPRRAFLRGMGYCQQQAEALQLILRGLRVPAELVQCTRNEFPPGRIHEYETSGGICGHCWLRVTIDGDARDVCPGSVANSPGKTHFRPLGRVTGYGGVPKALGHLGSAMLNVYWDRKARRALRGQIGS